MTEPLITILVPNYKTADLTKLCLRLLRKYTSLQKAKIIVIDNDSQDESLDYLRTVDWITLIERKSIPGESPAASHSSALDLALRQVSTPYVLSIHTDTLVKSPRWLDFLIEKISVNPKIAGVGSWKLEYKPWLRRFFKRVEYGIQSFYYKLIGKKDHKLEGKDHNYYYLRSHCAMYRTDLLKEFALGFGDNDEVAGKSMHKILVDKGYEMVFIPSAILGQYIEHINHATMVLNPELGSRQKSIDKGMRRIKKVVERLNIVSQEN